MIHDFVMLNAFADTPVARGELAQANAGLKTASEWCVSNRGSSDFRKLQMDRTTSIATFVAQSTRGDSACVVPQHTARQTSIRGLPDSEPLAVMHSLRTSMIQRAARIAAWFAVLVLAVASWTPGED